MLKKLTFGVVSMMFVGALVACSSDSDSSSSSAASKCKLPAGTYKVKYTKDPASTGATCVDLPESTVTITENQDGGTTTGSTQTGCTTTTDEAACSSTTKCSQTTSGITIDSTSTAKVSGGTLTGTTENTTKGSPAGDSSCKYSYAWTKQ